MRGLRCFRTREKRSATLESGSKIERLRAHSFRNEWTTRKAESRDRVHCPAKGRSCLGVGHVPPDPARHGDEERAHGSSEHAHQDAESTATPGRQRRTRYTSNGPIPPVDLTAARPGPSASDRAYDSPKATTGPASLESEISGAQRGLELDALVRETLLPAYRNAVDALDAPAALELATHIISAVRAGRHGEQDAAAAIKAGLTAAMVSGPNSPINDTPEAAQGRFAEVQTFGAVLHGDVTVLEQELALQLGPQMFKHKPVSGVMTTPSLGKDPSAYLANEASTVVALISVVDKARAISGATTGSNTALDAQQRKQIAALIEPWHSRPVNYAFLVAALDDIGLWVDVSAEKGPSGQTLAATLTKTQAQGLVTGALADVGDFDAHEAASLLPGDAGKQHVMDMVHQGDEGAATVFDRVRSAAPDARGLFSNSLPR